MTPRFNLKLAALALPIALAACGGGDGGIGDGNGNGNGNGGGGGGGGSSGYTLAGTISGLNESGLVLSNGSDRVTVAAGATTFALTAVASGAAYQVAVGTQPMWQNCSVTNGSGTMAGANVSDVAISCAQSIHVSTEAGANRDPGDGNVTTAGFAGPFGVAVDGNGNRYVSEPSRHMIRKIAANGMVTTIGTGEAGATDGAAGVAAFMAPFGLAVDAAGNVFVADSGNNKIRKITADGTVSTVAGDGTTAVFNAPAAVAVDAAGNLFVAEQGGHRIAKVANGTVSALAGGSIPGDADGVAAAAQFNSPFTMAIDGGALYVVEIGKNRVRKVMTGDGTVSTLAGADAAGFADGPGAQATFTKPRGIAAHQGNVYVVDGGGDSVYGDRIRRIKPDGTVSTFVPAWMQGKATDGRVGFAALQLPGGLAVDAAGDLLVTQGGTSPALRRISHVVPEVSSVAYVPGISARDVAVDRNGNYYLIEGSRVVRVSADGTVSTFAGTGVAGFADGPGAQAQFRRPNGLAVDASGNVYVSDFSNHRVRKIAPDGTVSTLAGTGVQGTADGPAASAQFDRPDSIAVDASGNVYVGDSSCRLRKITPDGNVTSVAGTGTCGVGADGVGQAASFSYPSGLAVDGSGNVYVADYDFGVRKVALNGTVTTLATPGIADLSLLDVAVDASGNVYALNENEGRLYRIGADGAVVHFAGLDQSGNTDGPRSTARFGGEFSGMTFDSRGYVVAFDIQNKTIRRISTAPGTLPAAPPSR